MILEEMSMKDFEKKVNILLKYKNDIVNNILLIFNIYVSSLPEMTFLANDAIWQH